MGDMDARAVLDDVQRLGSRVRADQHLTSAALLMGGLVTLVGVPFTDDFPSGMAMAYWGVALPVGFLALAAWLQLQRRRTGVGAQAAVWMTAGIGLAMAPLLLFPASTFYILPVVAVALVTAGIVRRQSTLTVWGVVALLLTPFWIFLTFPFLTAPLSGVGIGLLVLALWRRDGWLAAIAAVFTGLAVLDGFFVLSNALHHLGMPDAIAALLPPQAMLGLLLVAAGLLAWRRELSQ